MLVPRRKPCQRCLIEFEAHGGIDGINPIRVAKNPVLTIMTNVLREGDRLPTERVLCS